MAEAFRTARPAILAVVVSAGVSSYLPRTLAGIAAQQHLPDAVLLVDVGAAGREVGTGVPMHEAVEASGLDARTRVRVVAAPEAATFGDAVRLGLEKYHALLARAARRAHGHEGGTGSRTLAAVGPGWRTGEMSPVTTGELRGLALDQPEDDAAWLWLLHDDSAPHPAALDRLLHAAESGRSVAIAGAKQRGWARPERLLEVGLRTTRSARRVVDIEGDEIDQGQHDGREDVLAVGLAGALVRRDAWEELGGTDPALGPFGDGLELSRRARLAGHRVIVVPGAWVFHARATYVGLRGTGPDGVPGRERVPDPRRSYLARRRAQLYNWLKFAPLVCLPLIVLWLLVLAPLRALGRIATKDLDLAAAELGAVPAVLAQLPGLVRARHRARRTRRVPPRALRPLEASGGHIWRLERARRLQQNAARRAAEAPSELEMAERAALARRRRVTLGGLALILTAVALAAFAPLVVAGPLTGGALLPVDAGWAELWRVARSGWVPAGLGHPGPPDAWWTVLAVPMTALGVLGASTNVLLTALVVLAIPAAGLSAWFAAGAATRSVLLRGWVALAWALAPALLISTGQGRLGAVVTHLALPWVALGLARAVGVDRQDVILSGLVGAQRVVPAEPAEGASEGATEGASEGATEGPEEAPVGAAPRAPVSDDAPVHPAPARSQPPKPAPTATSEPVDPDAGGTSVAAEAAGRADSAGSDDRAVAPAPTPAPVTAVAGSLAAAAGAGLALAVVVAGSPVLLPVALVLLVLLAVVVPRHRRRLALVPLPALVLLGPVLTAALIDPATGWRALLADPGAPYATDAAPAWQRLLGWPVPALGADAPAGELATWLPLAAGVVLLVTAVLALARGGIRAAAVRTGWMVALLGLVTAAVSARLAVGVGPALGGPERPEELVGPWTGPALSLLALGLLLAVATGGDGMRGWLRGRSFGWRQLSAAVVCTLMVAGPVLTTADWLLAVRPGYEEPTDLLTVRGRPQAPVPALATELQEGAQRSRVLALQAVADGGVHAEVWRGAGPQLTGTAAVVQARTLTGPPTEAQVRPPDEAEATLSQAVATMTAGAAADAAQTLGDLAVGVVLVPPLDGYLPGGTAPDATGRTALVAQLDATPGLERVTENESGVVWRVSTTQPGAAESVARVRVLGPGGDWLQDLPSDPVTTRTAVEAGPAGRTVVLAERADDGWRAWYDGQPLRAVTAGWRQAFELPAEAGTLTVRYDPPWHTAWNVVQVVVLGLVGLLALPLRRRRTEVGP